MSTISLPISSEAVAAGIASHSQLRNRYTRVFRDVYVVKGTELTPASDCVLAVDPETEG